MRERLPHWLARLPLSLAIHVAVIAAIAAVVRMEPAPPALFIDLKEIIAGGTEEGAAGGDGSMAGAGAASGAAPAPAVRPERAPRAAPAPRRTPEPPATRERAPAPENAVTSTPPGLAVTPAPATSATPTTPAPAPPAPTTAAPPPSAPVPGASPPAPASGAQAALPSAEPPTAGAAAGGASSGAGSSALAASGADDRTAGGSAGGHGAGAERIGGGAGDRRALGVPGAGGGGDGAGEYGAYLARLRERLQQSLRYPTTARRRGLSGTVQLEIAIETDGAIGGVAVISSSSHDVLDRAAADAARALARQPFPRDVRARPLRVRLPVIFELQ